MQRKNIIAITLYGVILLSIAFLLMGNKGFQALIALFG